MRKRMHPVVLSIVTMLFIAPASVATAQQGTGPSDAKSSSPKQPSATSERSAERSLVSFKDGRLSVAVQGRSLERLASEISNGSGVPILVDSALAKALVTANLQNLPLDEGLRQILKNYDAFFFYGIDEDGPASLKVVWVYPKGNGRGMAPVPPEKWASTKELEKRLSDSNPEVRARAIEALIERKRGQAADAVAQALKDSDNQVRTQALYRAAQSGVDIPVNTVRSLALNDPSADVRFLALQSMANNPGVRAVAEWLLNDPSEPVRLEAQEILQRLDSGSQSPESNQTPQDQMQQPNQ